MMNLTKQYLLLSIYFFIIFIAYYFININELTNFSYTFLIYVFFLLLFPRIKWIRLPIFGLFNFILGIELFFSLKYGYISESLLKTALENDTNQSFLMIKNELLSIILPSIIFTLLYTFFIFNKIKISFKYKTLYWAMMVICCFFLFRNTLYYYLSDKRHVVEFQVVPFFP